MSDPIVGYMLGEFVILLAASAVVYAVARQISNKVREYDELKQKQRAAESMAGDEHPAAPAARGRQSPS